MKHAFFEGLKGPLHISHRGGAGLYPENTLYAFQRALEVHKSDVLELDVHASSDGEIVIAHDPTLERCTDGSGLLSEQPWSVLSRLDAAFHFTPAGEAGTPLRGKGVRLPSFRELLAATPGVRLNVDEAGPETTGAATIWKPSEGLQSLSSLNALRARTLNWYWPIGRSAGTVKFKALIPVAM